MFTLLAAAGAGLAAWRRSRPATDPWADPWEPATATPGSGTGEDAASGGGDALSRTREATKKAADRVAGAIPDLGEKVGGAKEAATRLASRRRAGGDDAGSSSEGDVPLTVSPEFGADTGDTLSTSTETVGTDVDDAPSDGAKNSAGQWGSGQSTTES